MKVKIINGCALYDPDLIGRMIESVLYISCMSKPSVDDYISTLASVIPCCCSTVRHGQAALTVGVCPLLIVNSPFLLASLNQAAGTVVAIFFFYPGL